MDNQSITDDRLFLMTFIFTIYFGPDMKSGPTISTSERVFRQSPPYESTDLASSSIRTTELERIFCYILRKAERIHQINLIILHDYLLGYLPENLKENYRYFSHFYPSHLHPYKKFGVANISFVHDPNVFHIRHDLVERFRILSKVENLVVDRNAAVTYNFADYSVPYPIPSHEAQPVEQSRPPKPQSNNGDEKRGPRHENSMVSDNDVLPESQAPKMVSGDVNRVVILALRCLNNSVMIRSREFKEGNEALPSSPNTPSGTKGSPMNNVVTENKSGASSPT